MVYFIYDIFQRLNAKPMSSIVRVVTVATPLSKSVMAYGIVPVVQMNMDAVSFIKPIKEHKNSIIITS